MTGLELFKEFGLLGLVVGSVVILLFFVVKWAFGTAKDIMKQASEERKAWNEAINKVTDSIDRHDEKADERSKYVREEHRQMIEVLGRINGYKGGNNG